MFVNLKCPECGTIHEFNIEIDIAVSTKKQDEQIITEIVSTDIQEIENLGIDGCIIEVYPDKTKFTHKEAKEIKKDLIKVMSKHGIEADLDFIP
jgi:hypothetical protein